MERLLLKDCADISTQPTYMCKRSISQPTTPLSVDLTAMYKLPQNATNTVRENANWIIFTFFYHIM